MAKNFKKLSKLTSACAGEQFLDWRNFWKFWIFLDFLQKPLACFSKFYLRVQSKNCGRNSFLVFLFRFFFGFWAKNFWDFCPENFKKLSKLISSCPEEQFVTWIFFKSFEPFWIFCRNLWHGSQNSIEVSRGKFAEETVFFTFLFRIFSDFERNFFRLLAKKLQDVFKTTFYVSRGTVCGFFFKKFWTVLNFLSKPLWWFSKFYLRVQSKICGRNSFFLLFFSEFYLILSEIFSEFWPKNFKKLSKLPFACPEEQFVTWFFLKFWIVLDFLHKPLAWL